jgi:CRP-like cAMP-binding protein
MSEEASLSRDKCAYWCSGISDSEVSLNTGPFKNALLKTLNPQIIDRLSLHPVTFEVQHEIEFPGAPIEHIFFIEDGAASMTTTFEDGSQVEVGMFGYQSVIGISALMGTKRSLNRVYTQIAGSGYASPIEAARKEFLLCGEFQTLALRYVQAQLVQATQTAGCNAKHDAEQRLARWLLICADRVDGNTFSLSHSLLSNMLGTSRSTISLAAGVLKEEGLIDYSRELIHILDVTRLETRACECYRVIKNHLDNHVEFDTGVVA